MWFVGSNLVDFGPLIEGPDLEFWEKLKIILYPFLGSKTMSMSILVQIRWTWPKCQAKITNFCSPAPLCDEAVDRVLLLELKFVEIQFLTPVAILNFEKNSYSDSDMPNQNFEKHWDLGKNTKKNTEWDLGKNTKIFAKFLNSLYRPKN